MNIKTERASFNFAVAPTHQIMSGTLRSLTARTKKSLSTLRVFIALLLVKRMKGSITPTEAIKEKEEEFLASYDAIQKMAEIDRTEISDAIGDLERIGLLKVERVGRSNEYSFLYPSDRWMKLPAIDEINALLLLTSLKKTAVTVGQRRTLMLAVLKMYLYILAARNKKTNRAFVTYSHFEEKCGVQRKHIRRVLSILEIEGLIKTERGEGKEGRTVHAYFVCGLGRYTQPKEDQFWS